MKNKIMETNTGNGENYYKNLAKSLPLTKGNWEVIKIDIADYKSLCIGSRSDEQVICNISPGNYKFSEKEDANANIISASKDLLFALAELYDSLPDGYQHECLPNVRKALLKGMGL